MELYKVDSCKQNTVESNVNDKSKVDYISDSSETHSHGPMFEININHRT